MDPFHQAIRKARKNLGYSTAKDFHRNKNNELSMSYESYANLEAGKYLPPADKLTNLVQALEIQNVRGFVFSYCFTLMPNELFKNFFLDDQNHAGSVVLKSDSYNNYKEKFHALLEFNRMQNKYELTPEQIAVVEADLATWDIINLFVGAGTEIGLSLEEIAEKTDSGIESTRKRVSELTRVRLLKQLDTGKHVASQSAFIIPRRPIADNLTHALVRRELEKVYRDKRNRPYTRFRFMSIDPQDRDNFEMFVDNFVLDSRRFKKEGGKTHYLQILFSDRNDL